MAPNSQPGRRAPDSPSSIPHQSAAGAGAGTPDADARKKGHPYPLREIPASLDTRLEALKLVASTQRLRPWYTSSWVPIIGVALGVASVGAIAMNLATDSLSHTPRPDEVDFYRLTLSGIPRNQDQPGKRLSVAPNQDVTSYFRQVGAPSRVYLAPEMTSWTLVNCGVFHFGALPIAVRVYHDEVGEEMVAYSISLEGISRIDPIARNHFFADHPEAVVIQNSTTTSVVLRRTVLEPDTIALSSMVD